MASAEDILTKIPGVNIFASMFGAQSDAEEDLIKQYKQMQQQYQAYRPVAQRTHMAGLENALSPGMLGPLQNQLTQMYGMGAGFDPSQLLRDPLAQGQQVGEQNAEAARRAALAQKRQMAEGFEQNQMRSRQMSGGFGIPYIHTGGQQMPMRRG